uniref:Helix turn helix protein n=1 Tax=Corticoviridae sp. TaxID=2832474 RepID=A0A8D9PE26_9VIRU|nr:MAG TPA: helix turn helix protein [Corticoviridae sp.]
MNTLDYLSAVKKKLGIESDYALAKALGITHSAICGYRAGRSRIDDDTALKISEILDMNPLQVIAQANAERAKTPEMRSRWMGLAQKLQASFELLLLPVGRRPVL